MSDASEISRRKVVILTVGGLAGLGLLGGGGYWLWRKSRFPEFAEDPEARAFALAMADAAEKAGVDLTDESVLRWCKDYKAFGKKLKRRKGRVSRKQVESLILSTDFFDPKTNGATKYTAHYNPHKMPCYSGGLRS